MITVGVLGGRWRGSVTAWGAIEQWDGLGTLDWFVAADDRWHVPSNEPSLRQARVEGTPVVETRLRVPQGDVVHRVYATADHGGITLIEVENDSPLPVAVAFAGVPVMSLRPPAVVPIQGIELPADATVFPVGHHATITVGLAHTPGAGRALPAQLPTAAQVAHGWTATCDRASRLVLPDQALIDAVMTQRCELDLAGPPLPTVDPIGFLMAVAQLVRMTGRAESWMPDVADAVAALVGIAATVDDPAAVAVALDAAALVAHRADDGRAGRDLAKVRARLAKMSARLDGRAILSGAPWVPQPESQPDARFVTAVEQRLANGPDLVPAGFPATWLGQNFEVHNVPTGPRSAVSFAIRWHGDRPAVLWECAGQPVTLSSSHLAPGWSTDQQSGETLWPAPDVATAAGGSSSRSITIVDEPGSFS